MQKYIGTALGDNFEEKCWSFGIIVKLSHKGINEEYGSITFIPKS